MKVRILGNSFRFRLKQPELERFAEEGRIEERIEFGQTAENCLSFCLQVTEDNDFKVNFQSNKIEFYLPSGIIKNWIETNQTGFEECIDTGLDRRVSLLVEKDFKCMEACAEDNQGSYERPFH